MISKTDIECYTALKDFFLKNKSDVFYGRQVEVIHEKRFYHWVVSRALRLLQKDGHIIRWEVSKENSTVIMCRHKSLRYYKKLENELIELVDEMRVASDHIGHHLENLMVAAFASNGYTIIGREQNTFKNKKWEVTNYDLDIIIEKDDVPYGVEIKNTLSYMDKAEFNVKAEMCKYLELYPVFVNRYMPSSWMKELKDDFGGFALILKYQIHPTSHSDLVEKMVSIGLFAGCPKWIEDGTINRFTNNFHIRNV